VTVSDLVIESKSWQRGARKKNRCYVAKKRPIKRGGLPGKGEGKGWGDAFVTEKAKKEKTC